MPLKDNFWIQNIISGFSAMVYSKIFPVQHTKYMLLHIQIAKKLRTWETNWIWFLGALLKFDTQTHILVNFVSIYWPPSTTSAQWSWPGAGRVSKRIFLVWVQYWYPWYPRSLTLVIFQRMIFYKNTIWWFAAGLRARYEHKVQKIAQRKMYNIQLLNCFKDLNSLSMVY